MKPSTTERATSSRLPIRARTRGSTNRAPLSAPAWISLRMGNGLPSHPAPRHGDGFEQLVDERVARHPFRLRMEIRQHAMAEHGMRQRPDVFEADVIAAGSQRTRL